MYPLFIHQSAVSSVPALLCGKKLDNIMPMLMGAEEAVQLV